MGKSTFRDYKNEHNNSSWKEHFNLDGLLEFLNSKITIGIIFTTKGRFHIADTLFIINIWNKFKGCEKEKIFQSALKHKNT